MLVFELVRQRRLLERYALLWLFSSAVLLGLSIWRGALEELASAVGIFYAPSALFAVAFGFVLVLLLHFSLVISRLAEQTKVLAQRVGLLQHEVDELRAQLGEVTARRAAEARSRRSSPLRVDGARRHPRRLPVCSRICRGRSRRCSRSCGEGDELLIVDNASSDDPARVSGGRACCGWRRTSGSRAAATRGRRRPSAPLLFFLNPDAVPASGCLDALRAAARRASGLGRVAGAGDAAGRARRSTRAAARCTGSASAGRAGTASRVADARGDRAVGFASGAALVVRREAWDAAGGFDARVLHVRRGPGPLAAAAAGGLGGRRRGRRGRRARLRVREGREQVVPARAQPLGDGARRLSGGAAARAAAGAARGRGWRSSSRRRAAGGWARRRGLRWRSCAGCRARCGAARRCRRRRR